MHVISLYMFSVYFQVTFFIGIVRLVMFSPELKSSSTWVTRCITKTAPKLDFLTMKNTIVRSKWTNRKEPNMVSGSR